MKNNDLVLLEDTNDEFNGRAGRVFGSPVGTLAMIRLVIPETGEFYERVYDSSVISVVDVETTTLLIEKCCSKCHKLNWDNKTGRYGEKHRNIDTDIDVLCDENGKLYVDGDLVPPAVV